MAAEKLIQKLPLVTIYSAYASDLFSKSALGKTIDEGLEREWKKHMGHVPYKIIDHKKPAVEALPELQEAEIMLADEDLIRPIFGKLRNTKWVQGTWAGVDRMMKSIDPADIPPPFKYTRLGGALGRSMAEYVIGHVVAHERQFAFLGKSQEKKVWYQFNYRTLDQLTIGIVGLGDIGQEIAKLCKACGMDVWGLGRRALAPDEISKYVDQYRTSSGLAELLANCDYVCSVLPHTPETDDLLSGDVLSACTKQPVFINIGRGNVISEEAILTALDKGWISHAILDVFRTEPLPESSPLWSSSKVTVTPHCSGNSYSHKEGDVSTSSGSWFFPEVIKTMKENYSRYVNGEPLKYELDWKQGY